MGSLALGFLGGFIAWVATTFVGQPVVALIAARNEAARVLALYQELDYIDAVEEEPSTEIILDERKKSLAAAGAQLIAYANANQMLMPALHKLHIRPWNAGMSLILLSQMQPNRGPSEDERLKIMGYLRLGRFGHKRVRAGR